MAAPRTTEQFFNALEELPGEAPDAAATQLVERALCHRSNHVVARAAELVRRRAWRMFEGTLVEAFGRALRDDLEDKGFAAKTALAETLHQLEQGSDRLFRRGARHRQREPVFGGQEDTAATLRSVCGMALLRLNPWDLPLELARLLADPEARVRENAARALAACGHPAAAPLLLHRALAGDPEPVVVGECLRGLLVLDAEAHLETVAAFLEERFGPVPELAALALGECRRPAAYVPLRRFFDRALSTEGRRCALLALGTLRTDEAFALLVEVARDGGSADARSAREALTLSAADPAIAALLETLPER